MPKKYVMLVDSERCVNYTACQVPCRADWIPSRIFPSLGQRNDSMMAADGAPRMPLLSAAASLYDPPCVTFFPTGSMWRMVRLGEGHLKLWVAVSSSPGSGRFSVPLPSRTALIVCETDLDLMVDTNQSRLPAYMTDMFAVGVGCICSCFASCALDMHWCATTNPLRNSQCYNRLSVRRGVQWKTYSRNCSIPSCRPRRWSKRRMRAMSN